MQGLGQNFLTNLRVLKKITAALCIKPGETIIEIGPGHGELTQHLIKAGAEVIAIEKDKKLAESLKRKINSRIISGHRKTNGSCDDQNIKIIEGDILKILPEITYKLQTTSYKLIGNIPYYITGYLLRIIGELENKPELIVLTIQKEVAERIIAKPPKMNLLATSVQFWAEPEILGIIPKKDFQPMPKIDSAIIKLKPKIISKNYQLPATSYYLFIKILFKQPRKTIFNNLRTAFQTEKIKIACQKLKINLDLRPQNLTLRQITELSSALNILKTSS